MGKVVRVVVGAALIVAGAVTGKFQLIIAGVSLVGGALLQPSNRQNRAAAAATLQLGEQPRQAVLGRAAVAGSLVDAFNYGGKYGTDWEVLVIALADHRCDALEGFFVDDRYVAFTGDGNVAGFNNQLQVFWRAGTWNDTVPSILTTNGPGWTANDRGRGVAKVVVAYKVDDEKAKNPIWPGGRPRFRWVVRGLRCYQARLDTTVGGSGAHRWNNPATWQWTENPIDIAHNWRRGIYAGDLVDQPGMLLIGRGLSAIEAPPANVFARANLCDEQVGGAARYRIGGVAASTEAFIDVESDFAAACAGVISQPEGAVEVDPGEAKAPVAHFTDADLIVGSKVRWNEGILGQQDASWLNTIVARYVEPAQRWGQHSAPVLRNLADVVADGAPREQQLALDFVTNGAQAQRVGEVLRRLGRLWGRGTVTLPPRFAFIEEGDWVTWQSDRRFGGATLTFQVEAWGSDRAWHHTLTLRQISASVFSDTAPLDDGSIASTRPPPPVVAAPAPNAWSAAAVMLDGGGLSVSALRVTGTVDDTAAQFVVFEYVQQLDPPVVSTNWTFAASSRPDVTSLDIPLSAGGRFFVAVSYVVDGILGPRVVLGPVDIGPITYPDGTPVDVLQPAEPGATEGAVLPSPGSSVVGNIRNHLGQIYNPGELLNTSLELTPDGRLQYRPLPDVAPILRGQLTLPDLGAASNDAMRRAEDDVDALATALATALDEASRTRQTFTDAGFYSDPATGQVRIHAVQQTLEQFNTAEVRLDAAEASINLRATTSYVNEQIALAVLDPSQIADLETIFVRLTAAEVDIDGINATITTRATATELSLVAGRVTTAEQAIDALQGTITAKVDTTTFDALATRVTSAETTLSAIGDTAQIVNAVTSVRLIEQQTDVNAEAALAALVQGDRNQREQVAALALARQELRTDITDGLGAEASARLALQVEVGENAASLATESLARASADAALSSQITQLTATTTTDLNALTAALTAEEATRTAAINDEADARVAAITAEAAARGTAISAEQQARINAINAERTQTLADIAAEAAARAAAVSTLAASIQTEQSARTTADSALAANISSLSASLISLSGDLADEETARIAAIAAEAAARIAAIQAEATTRGAALTSEQQARIAAINAEAQTRAAAIQAEANARTQAVSTLTSSISTANQARVAGDAALAASITSLKAELDSEASNRAAAVQTANQARIDGDALIAAGLAQQATAGRILDGEAADLADQLLSALVQGDRNRRDINGALAGVRQEITAQIVDDREAFASSLTALIARIAGAEASLVTEQQVRSTADEALASSVTALEATFDSEVADLEAAITSEQQARTNADSALATSITGLSATFTAAITTEQQARITAIQNEAQTRAAAVNAEANNRGTAIIAERDARIAAIQAEATARGSALTAEQQARIAAINAEAITRGNAIAAERTQTLANVAAEAAARQAAVTSLTASIQQEAVARANADTAIAGTVTTLTTTVNQNNATLTTFGESIDGLRVRWGARTDVNGRITGIVLNNDGAQGDFTVVSDKFKVVNPDTGAAFIDADESGLRLRNGRVIMDNGTFIKAIGVGFGTTGQFIEWFGPRPASGNLALCNEANALAYLKTDGSAYFGGSLSAGVLRNAARSTAIAANASVEVGPFGTNGDAIQVITSYSVRSGTTADYPATTQGLNSWDAAVTAWGASATGPVGNRSANANKSISCNVVVRVDRALGGAAPAQWATLTITGGTENLTGVAPTPNDAPGFLTYTRTVNGSITSTDNAGGTQNRTFVATITTRTDAVIGSIQSQIVAVTATEE